MLFYVRFLIQTTKLVFALIFIAGNRTYRGKFEKTSKSNSELSEFKICWLRYIRGFYIYIYMSKFTYDCKFLEARSSIFVLLSNNTRHRELLNKYVPNVYSMYECVQQLLQLTICPDGLIVLVRCEQNRRWVRKYELWLSSSWVMEPTRAAPEYGE